MSLRPTYEKPQKGNPHGLTVRQHLIPAKSIFRFVDDRGRVQVYDKARHVIRPAKPDDDLFCVRRHWDERAERGYMKTIEDAYQRVASKVALLMNGMLAKADSDAICRYYALLLSRIEISRLSNAPFSLPGVLSRGSPLSKDGEERLEKIGYGYIADDLTFPARQIHSYQIQRKIDQYVRVQMRDYKQWGMCTAPERIDILLSDYNLNAFIAVDPRRAFVAKVGRKLTEAETQDMNVRLFRSSERFVIARDFARCALPSHLLT